MNFKHKALYITIFFMGLLTGAEVDLFVPSLPQMQEQFSLTPFVVELCLSLNLIFHCIACFFVGALGDKYGRKPVIEAGLIVFIVGSILPLIFQNFPMILVGRALQGAGIAGCAVLAYVIIADTFSTKKFQEILAVLNGSIAFAMAFAPVIGSYISKYFDWYGNFVALLCFAVFCFLLSMFFVPKKQKMHEEEKTTYFDIMKCTKTLKYIFGLSFLVVCFWSFVGLSPILYIGDLGVPLEEFGYYQGTMAGCFAVLSVLSGRIINKFSLKKCFNLSLALLSIFIPSTFLLVAFDVRDPVLITANMMLIAFGCIVPLNTLYPLMLETLPNARGRIAAFQASFRMLLTGGVIQTASYFYEGNFKSIGICMLICMLTSVLLILSIIKKNKTILNPEYKLAFESSNT